MSSCWNQADVSVALSNAFEISLDSFQTSVLTGSATVGLEGDIIKLGDFLEPVSQLFNHCGVAFSLIFWNERMNV